MNTIVIGGGTGLLGTELTNAALRRGYDVVHLTRGGKSSRNPRVTERPWDPSRGKLDPEVLADAAAVVTLNGAGLLDRPWTMQYKKLLISSRIYPARTVADAIRALPSDRRPRVFIGGSATGYYGPDSLDAVLTEESLKGTGFLAKLCEKWEDEAFRAQDLTRVVVSRTGLVMSTRGGMLRALKPLYRLGLGVRLGSGKAWMPTIAVHDHARALLECIENETLFGPVNVTGPDPIRNREWNRLLAQSLHRRSMLAAPRQIIELLPGDMGREAVLSSARVMPMKLIDAGFRFEAPTVRDIFRQVL